MQASGGVVATIERKERREDARSRKDWMAAPAQVQQERLYDADFVIFFECLGMTRLQIQSSCCRGKSLRKDVDHQTVLSDDSHNFFCSVIYPYFSYVHNVFSTAYKATRIFAPHRIVLTE